MFSTNTKTYGTYVKTTPRVGLVGVGPSPRRIYTETFSMTVSIGSEKSRRNAFRVGVVKGSSLNRPTSDDGLGVDRLWT